MIPEGFHFLRPAWLLALVPIALLLWAGRRTAAQGGGAWRRVVDAHLLRHLLVPGDGSTRRWPLAAAALGLTAACVALAGPTWERLPQPAFAAVDPTVVVLDMSPAMNATDLRPSRLARARHELQDVLARSRGGQVGLVLYADEPFVAAPLTDDARVIEELVPSLERGLMPPRASRTDRAIAQAQALLEQAGVPGGRILLLTADAGAAPEAAVAAARAAAASGHTVSVLGVGAESDRATSPFDKARLEEIAEAGGGRFVEIRADASDVAALLPQRSAPDARLAESGSSAQADVWRDVGPWLVLVPLLLAPLAFRRGLVVALALVLVAGSATPSEAGLWQDLWSRRDQQGQAALAAGDAATAAELFEDPAWKAAARYESGAFAEAVESYRALPGTENQYNLGNALARAGQLEEAIAAYDEVLARVPDHEDAKFNRDLVQRLLDQQRQQQQQQQGGEAQQQDGSASSGDGEQGAQQEQQASAQGEPEAGSEGAESGAAEQQAAAAGDEQAQPEQPQDAQAQTEQAVAEQADAEQARHAQAQDAQDGTTEQQASARQASGAEPGDEEHDTASSTGARDHEEARADRTLAERLAEALGGDDADEPSEESPAPEDGTPSQHANASDASKPLDERAQAREQMLRSIPDDPGGLLRAKIRRHYAQKRDAQEVMSSW